MRRANIPLAFLISSLLAFGCGEEPTAPSSDGERGKSMACPMCGPLNIFENDKDNDSDPLGELGGGGGGGACGGGGSYPFPPLPDPKPHTCRIESYRNGCPNHPHVKFPLDDNYDGSATDEGRCLARAQDFGTWCGIGSHDYIKATSIGSYKRSEQLWIKQGCHVKLGQCPHSNTISNTERMDNYNSAGSSKDNCLKRATDYAQWCKTPKGKFAATATYWSGGKKVASRTAMGVYAPRTCVVAGLKYANTSRTGPLQSWRHHMSDHVDFFSRKQVTMSESFCYNCMCLSYTNKRKYLTKCLGARAPSYLSSAYHSCQVEKYIP